jgi:hypothetical protein
MSNQYNSESEAAQYLLDCSMWLAGGKEDGDGKDGKGRGASSSGATKQQQQGPNPSAFSVHVVVGTLPALYCRVVTAS